MDKVYKFYKYTRKHGASKAVRQTLTYAGKRLHVTKKSIDVMADIQDIVKADFHNHPYVRPQGVDKNILDIAWVLSPLSAGSGGQSTITRFARYLQSKGHTVTIYIYEGIQPQSLAEARRILNESFHLNVAVKKINQYVDADVVLATGWETAYPVFNLKTSAHKFYFVQDFEPLFYGVGSKTVLAENTYKMGFYGITAGKWLKHKLSTEYNMESDYFDFGADLDIYRTVHDDATKKKKICFYARPVTERRAFELGVISLEIFHKKHPEYSIEFFGWDVSDYNIPFPYVNHGILTPSQLASLYQDSAACLVLSLTNVSLLPLELLAAGCIPVVNEGDNNSMVLGENKYIHYADASPSQLADELSKVVVRTDINEYSRSASTSVEAASWQASYEKVESILKREVAKGAK